MNNPYIGKYKKASQEGDSIIIKSIEASEKSIALLKAAKKSLKDDDKDIWGESLRGIFEQVNILSACGNAVKDQDISLQLARFYLDLSMRVGRILVDSSKQDAADELLGKFEEVKSFWKDIQMQITDQSQNKDISSNI